MLNHRVDISFDEQPFYTVVGLAFKLTFPIRFIAFLKGGKEVAGTFYFTVSHQLAAAPTNEFFSYDENTPDVVLIGMVPTRFPRIAK